MNFRVSLHLRVCQISLSYLGCSIQVATMVLSWAFSSSGDSPIIHLGVIPHLSFALFDLCFSTSHTIHIIPFFNFVFCICCGFTSSSLSCLYPFMNPSKHFPLILNLVLHHFTHLIHSCSLFSWHMLTLSKCQKHWSYLHGFSYKWC